MDAMDPPRLEVHCIAGNMLPRTAVCTLSKDAAIKYWAKIFGAWFTHTFDPDSAGIRG